MLAGQLTKGKYRLVILQANGLLYYAINWLGSLAGRTLDLDPQACPNCGTIRLCACWCLIKIQRKCPILFYFLVLWKALVLEELM